MLHLLTRISQPSHSGIQCKSLSDDNMAGHSNGASRYDSAIDTIDLVSIDLTIIALQSEATFIVIQYPSLVDR